MKKVVLIGIICFAFIWAGHAHKIQTDVLVVGGTASGTSAAIQAARNGADVVLVEPTPWLGGMLTAAGVSATDGNHKLPSGLWGEFRQHIYEYYGGPEAVNTGWVSNTHFEPQVGNRILKTMARKEDRLIRIHGYHIVEALVERGEVQGAVFVNEAGTDTLAVHSQVTVDATEMGDLMAQAGCNYFIGQDPQSRTHEHGAPEQATSIIQDLTYVAILKDYGEGADKTIPEPDDYTPSRYNCTCNKVCTNEEEKRYTCKRMLSYGKLPNNKYMINWPYKGNDYYLNVLEKSYQERKEAYQKAKEHTLGWIHFIQTQGGYEHLGLAEGEFPTEDDLALYPYHRESRRLDGVVQLRNMDLVNLYESPHGDLFKTGIAVGDYPLDLHHKKMPREIYYDVRKVPAFNVPYGTLIPKKIDGLIVAEKSISVSHIVNGCTRLQPVVMLIGQAAGAAAAQSINQGLQPREVNIRDLQQSLLDAGCWLMPLMDVKSGSPYFQPVQRIALSGVLRGEGLIEGWANKMKFYPDQPVKEREFVNALEVAFGFAREALNLDTIRSFESIISREEAALRLWKSMNKPSSGVPERLDYKDVRPGSRLYKALQFFQTQGALITEDYFEPDRPVKRKELAVWLDHMLDPFHSLKVQMVPEEAEGTY